MKNDSIRTDVLRALVRERMTKAGFVYPRGGMKRPELLRWAMMLWGPGISEAEATAVARRIHGMDL